MTIIFGKIYSNNCVHCQMMQPEWDKLKDKLPDTVTVVEIEASQNETDKIAELNDKYVTSPEKLTSNGYPTIFKIQNGAVQYYEEGERTAENMLKWLSPLNNDMPKHCAYAPCSGEDDYRLRRPSSHLVSGGKRRAGKRARNPCTKRKQTRTFNHKKNVLTKRKQRRTRKTNKK